MMNPTWIGELADSEMAFALRVYIDDDELAEGVYYFHLRDQSPGEMYTCNFTLSQVLQYLRVSLQCTLSAMPLGFNHSFVKVGV